MALDFVGSGDFAHDVALRERRARGRSAYLTGVAAEEQVARHYTGLGAECLETRWRGQSGEIDLVFRLDGVVVFVEVKAARTMDRAIASLGQSQITRLYSAGAEYLAHVPEGQLADVRFDLATVDGQGRISVLENAFGHF